MGVRILLGTPFRSRTQIGKAGWLKPNCLEIRLLPRAPASSYESAAVAQLAEAAGLNPVQCRIVACLRHQLPALPVGERHRKKALSSEEERRSYKPKVEIS